MIIQKGAKIKIMMNGNHLSEREREKAWSFLATTDDYPWRLTKPKCTPYYYGFGNTATL